MELLGCLHSSAFFFFKCSSPKFWDEENSVDFFFSIVCYRNMQNCFVSMLRVEQRDAICLRAWAPDNVFPFLSFTEEC